MDHPMITYRLERVPGAEIGGQFVPLADIICLGATHGTTLSDADAQHLTRLGLAVQVDTYADGPHYAATRECRKLLVALVEQVADTPWTPPSREGLAAAIRSLPMTAISTGTVEEVAGALWERMTGEAAPPPAESEAVRAANEAFRRLKVVEDDYRRRFPGGRLGPPHEGSGFGPHAGDPGAQAAADADAIETGRL